MPLSDAQQVNMIEFLNGALRAKGIDKGTADEISAIASAAYAYAENSGRHDYNPETAAGHGEDHSAMSHQSTPNLDGMIEAAYSPKPDNDYHMFSDEAIDAAFPRD